MSTINQLIRPIIRELAPYSSARDEFTGKEGVFLDANENPFGTLNRYPDPYQSKLKQELAKLKNVQPNTIFIGNGSDEVIDLAYRVFCNPGEDKALTFSPTYGMYDVSAAINNIQLIKVPLNETFQIEREAVQPFFEDRSVKLMFICSPNNPTGNLMNRRDVEYILDNFKGVVLVDEAYVDFADDASLIPLIDKYDNLIVSQTFSKAWGLAAARVGVAYSNETLIKFFNKVKPPYNVSQLNQEAVLEALKNKGDFEEKRSVILTEKARLYKELLTIEGIKKIYPSDANFLLIEVENADQFYSDLIALKIVTRNRNKQVKNCLRVSIGSPEENQQLINALKNSL